MHSCHVYKVKYKLQTLLHKINKKNKNKTTAPEAIVSH